MAQFAWPNDINPPIYFANNQWAVTSYGLECLTAAYAIEKGRLAETNISDKGVSDWVVHLAEKNWVDIHELTEAMRHAFAHHRVRRRTLIDLDRSKAIALRNRRRHEEFDEFCEKELGGLSKKTEGAFSLTSYGDWAAAAELFRERQAERRRAE